MKKLMLIWVFSNVLGLFMSCGLNSDLFAPTDDSGSQDSGRRDRREPTNDDDKTPPVTSVLFLPLVEGASWTYAVEFRQSSLQSENYMAVYTGEETCTCSSAKFSDSTFVFQTRFSGKKNHHQQQRRYNQRPCRRRRFGERAGGQGCAGSYI